MLRYNKFSIKDGLNAVTVLHSLNTLSKSHLYYACMPRKYCLLDVLLGKGSSTERVDRSCSLVSRVVLSYRERIPALCTFTRMQRLHFRIIYHFGLPMHACFSNRNYVPDLMSLHLFEVGRSASDILDDSYRVQYRYFSRQHLNQREAILVRIRSIAFLCDQWSSK